MATALFSLPTIPHHHNTSTTTTDSQLHPHHHHHHHHHDQHHHHHHHHPPAPTEDPGATQHEDNTHHHTHSTQHADHNQPGPADPEETANLGSGVDLGTLAGRRITLKPRRTLSLSPTPARTCGDMSMGRNLWAATTLDNTNKDDDDGLCRPSYNAPAKKGEIPDEENNNNGPSLKPRTQALGTSTSHIHRRPSGSVKRPLDQVLPCQEIQYLDISYQKVGTVMVQFSPIPRKKIAYHPVLHHSIHYCDVPYCPVFDKPIKRKMLQRSKSHAGTELRERSDADWTSPYKFR